MNDSRACADLVCDHCGIGHVRVAVQPVRCRCAGTGFVAVPGPWGGWEQPCEQCPRDGWVWVFSGIEVDRQVQACRRSVDVVSLLVGVV